jgi:hypothetical protein
VELKLLLTLLQEEEEEFEDSSLLQEMEEIDLETRTGG